MDRPTEAEWIDVKRILKSLRGTRNYGLLCGAGNSKGVLDEFSDDNFAGDVRTRRSASGVVAVYATVQLHSEANYNGSWHCQQKQNLSQPVRVQRAAWLKRMLGELGGKGSEVPALYVDNLSAVKLAKNPEFHKRSKRAEVRCYSVRVSRIVA